MYDDLDIVSKDVYMMFKKQTFMCTYIMYDDLDIVSKDVYMMFKK